MQLKTDKSIFPTEETLLCPVCGFYYIHPICVKVATEKTLIAIDSEGLTIIRGPTQETKEAFNQRGARILLEYVCESRHHGHIIFQFHKGNTFIEHEQLPETAEVKTLWRT